MNYRDLSLKIKVDLKLIAPLYRGREVTRSRLEHSNALEPSTYMPWMLDSSTLEARYGHGKIHILSFHELS